MSTEAHPRRNDGEVGCFAMVRKPKPLTKTAPPAEAPAKYEALLGDVATVIEESRRAAARSVNAVMTATYWLVGRRIVEEEQGGKARAGYGQALLARLARDLVGQYGRGFSVDNLETMRAFFSAYPATRKSETASRKSLATPKSETPSRISLPEVVERFRLSWSHYVLLVRTQSEPARAFYEQEALRGGWTVRQLRRQIDSQLYERTALSRDKAAMLTKGARRKPEDHVTAEEELKEPYVLEFLGLRDEYSESDLEDALIRHLETFLLELGGDFTFVGRQRRLRVGAAWYRVDLLFFHRRLRCLVVIDLKLGEFTHADAGQMHLYLNYAREHWTMPQENPPVGLVLCAKKDHAVAKYALEGLPNKVVAAEYRTALPSEGVLVRKIEEARRRIEESRRTNP